MAIEILEVKTLPLCCLNCQEAKEGEELGVGVDAYCYNCDYALERFKLIENPHK